MLSALLGGMSLPILIALIVVIAGSFGAVVTASGGQNMPGPVRVWTQFKQVPLCGALLGAGAATGAGGDVNVMLVPGKVGEPTVGFEYTMKGTQTILAPAQTANGLDIGLDQTDNDGVELDNGITAINPVAFTVGTDGACYLKVTAKIADASGADPFLVGFRKVAARQGDYNDYTDFAGIGDYAGNIKTETALNNGATVTTDTTDDWADAASHELAVYVSGSGVVTYQVDGAAPTTVAAYTFDDGDQIMPFIFFLNGTDVAGTVELSLFDAGLQ